MSEDTDLLRAESILGSLLTDLAGRSCGVHMYVGVIIICFHGQSHQWYARRYCSGCSTRRF